MIQWKSDIWVSLQCDDRFWKVPIEIDRKDTLHKKFQILAFHKLHFSVLVCHVFFILINFDNKWIFKLYLETVEINGNFTNMKQCVTPSKTWIKPIRLSGCHGQFVWETVNVLRRDPGWEMFFDILWIFKTFLNLSQKNPKRHLLWGSYCGPLWLLCNTHYLKGGDIWMFTYFPVKFLDQEMITQNQSQP